MGLTAQEHDLTRVLAIWLMSEMVSRLEPDPQGLLWDIGQSNFELGCDALARVGAMAGAGQCMWRVVRPVDDPLPAGVVPSRRDLDHLLDALACHIEYVGELCRSGDAVHPLTRGIADLCAALAACGYMDAVGGTDFEWTDAFGPWMARRGRWDLTEFEPAPVTQVKSHIAAMPQKRRDWLSGRLAGHSPEFVRLFFDNAVPCDDWDMALASGAYSLLHEDTA